MEPKVVLKLYLIGKILDCDSPISRFNFQWASATRILAETAELPVSDTHSLNDDRPAHTSVAADPAIKNVGAGNGANQDVYPLIGYDEHAGCAPARAIDSVCEEGTLELVGLAPFVDNREVYRRCGGEMNLGRGEPKVLRRDATRLGVPTA